MSVTDVAARIQQLQSQFALLNKGIGQAGGVAGGDAFAAAMASATEGPGSTTAALATDGTDLASALSGLTGTGTPAAGTASEQSVVAEARKYLGVPYVWGGTDPQKGLDCSGLVQLVYKNLGIDLPRVSYQQATQGQKVANLDQARPGDLLAFGSPTVNHIAIYIGDGKMIHAPRPGENVEVSDVYTTPVAIRRILPDSTTTARIGGVTAASGALSTPYADLFQAAESKYGVPATLLAAVAKQESGYNASAVSPAGARGLMQIMPATAQGLGVDPMQPAQAVDGAARLLKDLIGRFGRVDHALAAYNAGPGAVLRYDGIPPYPETQRYVPAVLGIQRDLEAA
ncbi:NlpC/P60 family protein [Nocardioides iriomotensis]|uniref:Lytic transglycosylase n=1 Tax=Nocardioides iriomotensis TaxID=715784 RepID=A0A4Q5IWS2_9ACTN|nr:NlpC/P60 family protein [Nocardioides iriomotensis]RYU10542.1 lytic transglycosylase [Nocardioides iriomotensis]